MALEVLVIADAPAVRKSLAKLLCDDGFRIREAADGKQGIALAFDALPDLVVLDLALPGSRGADVCRTLKMAVKAAGVPVLILTGEDREGLEISCLDLGADDYLTKPAPPERLLARCRALLRRSPAGAVDGKRSLALDGLELDYAAKTAVIDGRRVEHLTPREFEVLYDLARHHPASRDRATLYRELWRTEAPSEGSLKTVEVHVRRIRMKMGWDAGEWLNRTAGRGYSLVPPR